MHFRAFTGLNRCSAFRTFYFLFDLHFTLIMFYYHSTNAGKCPLRPIIAEKYFPIMNPTRVSLRVKKTENGKGLLFLDYYPPVFNKVTRKTIRHEYIHYSVYLDPKDETERQYNAEMMRIGEAIRCKRVLDLAHEGLGLFDESRLKLSFLPFFRDLAQTKQPKWYASYLFFEKFTNGKCRFMDLSVDLSEKFRDYLLKEARKKDGELLNHNTASAYYSMFRCALKEAYKLRFIQENLNDFLERIPENPTHRNYLTLSEVKQLARTPCDIDVLKRASMFSIFTGLRISDIMSLQWENIVIAPDGGPCIVKRIEKVDRNETIFISEEALSYCGYQYSSGPVFRGLERSMIYRPLKKWLKEAGIEKDITFHCFRHTYATLQIAGGTDIYTVSHQLTHRSVKTTQIYADLVDEKRRASANAISLTEEKKVDAESTPNKSLKIK